MSTIDNWEADIKEGEKLLEDYEKDRRILALIDLVRAKDEALRFYSCEVKIGDHVMKISPDERMSPQEFKLVRRWNAPILNPYEHGKTAREALALTESLK